MTRTIACTTLLVSLGLFVVGCASETDTPFLPTASGGGPGSNPTSTTGGTSAMSSSGGNNSVGSGGNSPGQGGAGNATGGTNSTTGGTANASGGTGTGGRNTGGSTATGGKAAGGASSGGSTATGGKAAGGSTATGGKAAGGASSGGSTATGGKAAGGASTGGSTATGGATGTCQKFSFFVTSMAAMIRLSGSNNGFGGDLRFGKADGLEGADAICASVAATALPCAASKTWKAFLCTGTVDGIDRVGAGPWYDRKERLVWNSISEMSQDRPPNAPAIIKDDLPNEDGIPNHDYDQDGSTTDDDNHDILTGCGKNGRKITSDTTAHRCNEWTSTTAAATGTGGGIMPGLMMNGPMCGHSWPRQGSGINWVSSIREGGCGAGINLQDTGGATQATVGSGGGYGGIYCFATTP